MNDNCFEDVLETCFACNCEAQIRQTQTAYSHSGLQEGTQDCADCKLQPYPADNMGR